MSFSKAYMIALLASIVAAPGVLSQLHDLSHEIVRPIIHRYVFLSH